MPTISAWTMPLTGCSLGMAAGGLAVIDTDSRLKIADIPLKAHPESFQLEHTGRRIFVNVPEAHEIAIVDRSTNRQVASPSARGRATPSRDLERSSARVTPMPLPRYSRPATSNGLALWSSCFAMGIVAPKRTADTSAAASPGGEPL